MLESCGVRTIAAKQILRNAVHVHCAGQLDILLIFLVAGFLFIDHICSYFLCGFKTLRDTNEFLYVKHRDD